MKKYFVASCAAMIALAMVAFTHAPKKFTTQSFQFNGDPTVQTDLTDFSKWSAASISCSGTNQEACRINSVSDIYYHLDANNNPVLNSNGNGDPGDSDFSLTATSFTSGGTTTYYVTSPASGTAVNKPR